MRTAIGILLGILALALAVACGEAPPRPLAPAGPSVLLVTVDTLRADHTGPGGYDLPTTPNLDGLARRGTVFTRCLAVQPETGPSIASTMTGRYPREIGVRENGDVLPGEFGTLAEAFAAAGYETAAFVSTYLLKPHACGLDRGFATYDHRMTRANLGHEGFERLAGETAARAAAWARSMGDRRFFLWVHLYDPHGLYDPGEQVAQKFRRETGRPLLDPSKIVSYQRFGDSLDPDDFVARYDGEIFLADRAIGVLVDAMGPDSVVAVHADHGEGLGEHDYWFRHGALLDEAALHVPLVMAGPGVPEGRRESALAQSLDLGPTLLALAGLSPMPGTRGRDLLAGGVEGPEVVFAEARPHGADRTGIDTRHKVAATTATHRMVLWPATGESALFDLRVDPAETQDVSRDAPEVADRLGTAIRRWLLVGDRRSGDPGRPDVDRALRGLGYIEGGGEAGD